VFEDPVTEAIVVSVLFMAVLAAAAFVAGALIF
jgi:hypothetical protein